MSILDITEPISEGANTSIDEYEVHEYEPITGTNLNNAGGHIRINIETQDLFTHPSESYLIFTGELIRGDNGAVYNPASNISLTNNGLMYLFKNIKYQLSGQEIESITDPGQATTMLGLLEYLDDFSKSQGLNQLWNKDTEDIAANRNEGFKKRRDYIFSSVPVGTFSFKVPLKHIFGFCEDYTKVLYGMKQTLTLTRSENSNAIFRTNAADGAGNIPVDGRVTLHKISWYMPHVMPADKEKMELYKHIEKKEKFPVGYRMIQCDSIQVPQASTFNWRLSVKSSPEVLRFIIIGFQTARQNNHTMNASVFDNVNIKNIYVMLNSVRYPAADYDLSFTVNRFSRAYGDAASFRCKFYNMDELVSNSNISPVDYKTLYPLFVFDVSKQSEKLKYSTTDIRVKAFFNANVPANTEAYAVIISDRLLSFQSDGNKMSVVI